MGQFSKCWSTGADTARRRRVPFVRLCAKSDAISEFALSEHGRWESHGEPVDCTGEEVMAFNILNRFRTTITMYSQEEVDEVWWSLCSGTFQVYRPRAARGIAKRLKPHVTKKLLKKYPFPDCLY